MKLRAIFLGVFAFFVPAASAPAWNAIGHIAVAKLAFDELSEAHQKRLFLTLKRHPHYQEYLAFGRPKDVSEVEWAVVRSAVWPDWIRGRKKDASGATIHRFHRGEDHYINIPFIDPKDADFFAKKSLQDPDSATILSALKQRANLLRTRNADFADKAVAASWLFHLVGDIHQPMHAVSYYSSAPGYVQGDMGGNKFGIVVGNRKWKLHAFWDDLFGDDANYIDDSATRQKQIYEKGVTVARNLRPLMLNAADVEKLEKNTSFESWAQESFELAKSVAYRNPDGSLLKAGTPIPFDGPIPDDLPEAPDGYAKAARAVADVRVVLAGKRLARRVTMLFNASKDDGK